MSDTAVIRYRHERALDFKISMTMAIIAMAVGSIGVLKVIFGGDHGALGSSIPWGLWVSAYVYLVWMEVGMILGYYALKHVLHVKGIETPGPVIVLAAISALVAALTTIGMDLGHPFRAWRAMVFPDFGSLMTWMIWLHTFYMALLVVEFWAYHNDYKDLIKWLNWVNIPAGVALIVVIGSLFGVVGARPMWNSSLLPMAFANLITALYPGVPARVESMRLLLFGPYWWSIWLVHLGLGIATPLLLLVFLRQRLGALLLASILLVTTFATVPLNLVIPGLAHPTPELRGVAEAYHHPKLAYSYFPALTEWLAVLFALGVGLALFSLGYRYFLEDYYRKLASTEVDLDVGGAEPQGSAS